MRDDPLISIIMGTYNCEKTIEESIHSIFSQTYTNWELIVCDDGSTDATTAQLRALANESPSPMRVTHYPTNKGLAHALNVCLAMSSAPLIARMDGDDLSMIDRLRVQVDYLKAHPEVDMVGTAMQRFNEEGLADLIKPVEYPDRWTLRRSIPFCHATIMARRKVFDELGGYVVAPRTTRAQDLDLWFRFFHAGFTGTNISAPLYLVREDRDAVQRRTPWSRLQSTYVTMLIGYKLLGYPPQAYIRPTLELTKALIPGSVASYYRTWQKKRFKPTHRT